MIFAAIALWTIATLATAGVIVRPFRLPEALWAVIGAGLLVACGLLPPALALRAALKGGDVYLFLTGMMLLSETARREGLFDWVAVLAVNHARGSCTRLFLLVYGVGIGVTALLSNDATAVVLTPAVFAATRKARVEPLPYLFICALIANAASFVLPISNPANLVLYGDHPPALGPWLARFALPSALSIAGTYAVLRRVFAHQLNRSCESAVARTPLGAGARTALAGLALTTVVLLAVSALGWRLGLPTCLLGLLTTAVVLAQKREAPWPTLRGVSWSVLPLVAGLFVLVAAIESTGAAAALARLLQRGAAVSVPAAAGLGGGMIAVACNLVNNLPAGLIASTTIAQSSPPQKIVDTLLIGVDLGPNLSITGSLATILWLAALRREGQSVGFWRFLGVGARVAPAALLLAIGARLLLP